MNNWKDKWLILLTALMALLGLDRGYQYATAPGDVATPYEATAPRIDIEPAVQGGEVPNATEWTLLITYRVSAEVSGPPALPSGYNTSYLYTWPRPVVLYSRVPPKLADITAAPPALKGQVYLPESFEVLASRPPGKRAETPIEREEAVDGI